MKKLLITLVLCMSTQLVPNFRAPDFNFGEGMPGMGGMPAGMQVPPEVEAFLNKHRPEAMAGNTPEARAKRVEALHDTRQIIDNHPQLPPEIRLGVLLGVRMYRDQIPGEFVAGAQFGLENYQRVLDAMNESLRNNPNGNIKLEIDNERGHREYEVSPEEAREIIGIMDSAEKKAPGFLNDLGDSVNGIKLKDEHQKIKDKLKIKVNGHEMVKKTNYVLWGLVGVGAAAVCYGIYNYFNAEEEKPKKQGLKAA